MNISRELFAPILRVLGGGEGMRHLSHYEGLPLVELDLDHNAIQKAENLGADKLPNLRVLRLGFNSIEDLSNFRNCLALAVLDVRFNK